LTPEKPGTGKGEKKEEMSHLRHTEHLMAKPSSQRSDQKGPRKQLEREAKQKAIT